MIVIISLKNETVYYKESVIAEETLEHSQVLKFDQKFFNSERKRESSTFIWLNVQNSHHDYLYKVPSFRTVSQKFFFSNIFHHRIISHSHQRLNDASSNHHTVQPSGEYAAYSHLLLLDS